MDLQQHGERKRIKIDAVLGSRGVEELQRTLAGIGMQALTRTPSANSTTGTPQSAKGQIMPSTRFEFLATLDQWCQAVEVLQVWTRDGRIGHWKITISAWPSAACPSSGVG